MQRFVNLLARPQLAPLLVFVVAVLAALLFRVLTPASFQGQTYSDYVNFYEPVARNLLAGRSFTLRDGTISTIWGPGFAVILAGVFALSALSHMPESILLFGFVLLCLGLTAVFVYALARLIWPQHLATAAALLWAFYPFNLWFVFNPYSELPYMLLQVAALYGMWLGIRRRDAGWYALCGALLGFAALIRPIAIGLPVLCALVVLLGARDIPRIARVGRALLIVAAFVVVIAPWIIGIHQTLGEWIPISSTGFRNIVGGLTYATVSGYNTASVPPDLLAIQNEIAAQRPASTEALMLVVQGEFQRNPLSTGMLLALKLARSWYATYSGNFESLILLVQLPFLLVLLAGARSLWRTSPGARPMLVAHWLVVFYFWGMSTLVVSNLRYLAPALGLVFVFAPGILYARRPNGRAGK